MEIRTTEYTPEMGDDPLTEQMRQALAGKSIEEQLDYFAVVSEELIEHYSYGDLMRSKRSTTEHPLRQVH